MRTKFFVRKILEKNRSEQFYETVVTHSKKNNKTNMINNEFYFLNIINDSKENSTEKKK